jgi:hypothetical protein
VCTGGRYEFFLCILFNDFVKKSMQNCKDANIDPRDIPSEFCVKRIFDVVLRGESA